MKIINAVLLLAVIGMTFLLVKTIQDPIAFDKAKQERRAEVIEKLTYIKELQLAHKDVHGYFSETFDSLAIFVQQDTFKLTKVIGDPDELDAEGNPVPVTYEEVNILVKDSMMNPNFDLKNLNVVPGVEGEKFEMQASTVERGRIIVPVFKIYAKEPQYLKGLQARYINADDELRVGSMTEPNYNGNW